MTIGFIGLGKMGRGMASNLQTKGFSLMVFDVVEAPVAALEALGAKRGSIQEIAAACDIVVTVLPTGKEVNEVILAPGGVLDHAKPGTLILDLSTIDPDTTDRLHEEARRRGMTAVDAPIGRLAWHAQSTRRGLLRRLSRCRRRRPQPRRQQR